MTVNGIASALFDRLQVVAVARRPPPVLRYPAALSIIACVAVVQLSLLGASAPWFLYTPAVALIALLLGGDAALLATGLSATAAGYAVRRPDAAFIMTPTHWGASLVFVVTTIGLIGLMVALRQALIRTHHLHASREADLRESSEREAFLGSVLAASTDCIQVLDLNGAVRFMSEGGMAAMEVSNFGHVRGCPWPDLLKVEDAGPAREAIRAAEQGRSSHFEMEACTLKGTPRYWSVSVSPIRSASGDVVDILTVSRDHTALQVAREQQRLLNGELDHRLKNIFVLVQSIATQTLRSAASLPEASAALSARLVSLGQATALLTAASWETAELSAVVEAGLTAAQDKRGRITAEGPRVRLGAQAALAFTLALHELTTNARKYGALSTEGGAVMLRWRIDDARDEPYFHFAWVERGGPVVRPPPRRGFGSRMIERALCSYLEGRAAMSFAPEGVELNIDAPLACVEVEPSRTS